MKVNNNSQFPTVHSPLIPPGYKQTEVGVIPEEWEVFDLQEACRETITYGIVQCGPHIRDGVPYVRVSDMDEPELSVDGMLRTSKSIAAKFARSTVKEGDLVYALRGKLGEVRQVRSDVAGANLTQGTARLSPNEQVASGYLVWAMRHPRTVRQAELEAKGTTFREITLADLRCLKVLVPPLPEQCAIATALSDVDGLLGGLDRLIAKKRDLKQAAMQQLLTGQTRLPGFHGEWEVKTLFELAERKKEFFDDGDWIESEHITTEGIRLIQTGNIGVGSFVEKDDKKYINEASFTSLRCKQLKQGDLLVCRLADPAGRACVLGDIGEERIVTSVDVTIFRPPPEMAHRLFLCQVFSTSDWFRAVSDRSGGTTHKRISRGALGRLSINLPPLPEQTAIAEVLTEMDAELAGLEQRREKTRALKQAMMQELLTGITRLV